MRNFALVFVSFDGKITLMANFWAKDSEDLKSIIENAAMRYEEFYQVPFRCTIAEDITEKPY